MSAQALPRQAQGDIFATVAVGPAAVEGLIDLGLIDVTEQATPKNLAAALEILVDALADGRLDWNANAEANCDMDGDE